MPDNVPKMQLERDEWRRRFIAAEGARKRLLRSLRELQALVEPVDEHYATLARAADVADRGGYPPPWDSANGR